MNNPAPHQPDDQRPPATGEVTCVFGCSTPRCTCAELSRMEQFQDWLDRQLQVLIHDNSSWETGNSNRKFFGR